MSRDVVIVACAVSAGVHAALVGDHLAFGPAAAVLLGLAVLLQRGRTAGALVSAILVLGGLIASYVAAVTVGIPWVHPEREPLSGLGLATKAIEAAGLVAALNLKGLLSWPLHTTNARFHSRWSA